MWSLLITVLFAIPVAIFATTNDQPVSISFLDNVFPSIPLYLIVLITLAIGIIFASLLSVTHRLSTSVELHKRISQHEAEQKKTVELTKRVHELEVLNAEMKAKYEAGNVDAKSI